MDQIAWIGVVDDKQAPDDVRNAYGHAKTILGEQINIMRAMSLWPAMLNASKEEMLLFFGRGTELSDQIKYLIAAHIAQLNNSFYGRNLYGNCLRRCGWSDEKVSHILQDIDSEHLAPNDRAVLRFADKITRKPQSMNQEDLKGMRLAGLSDKTILETALLSGYINSLTRTANALGVQVEKS